MASMERMSSFRHEGHIFFIYDHTKKTEEDDPKDAILYFYPSFVGTDDQVALVGGIIGLADFCLEFIPQSVPSIIKLSFRNFALLQHEDFIIGLGGSPDIPDSFLTAHMQFVWSTFVMYQGSLSALKKRVSANKFVDKLKNVWDYYLPLRQIQEDPLSQAFQVLPYVQLHKSQGHLFLHASHILQRSLTYAGVLAGAIFNKNKVLCTQLSNGLTRQLLLLMSHSQFPCVEANSVVDLPGGVRLLHVYLPKNECVGLGYRRKKAYVYPKDEVKRKERSSSDQNSKNAQPSISTPGYISAHNFFSDGVNSSGNDMLKSSSTQFQNGTGISSDAGEASTSAVSPTGGLTSGTDSEVFLDTLSDITFDSQNQLQITDVKQMKCATSSTNGSNLNTLPHQDASSSDLASTKAQNNVLVATQGLTEQLNIGASELLENKSLLEVTKPFSNLSLNNNVEKNIETQNETSNDISNHANNLNLGTVTDTDIKNTVFNKNKNSKQNERSLAFDELQIFENATQEVTACIEAGHFSQKPASEISSELVVEVADSVILSGSFSHSYSDSVDYLMTSTDSSHPDHRSSSSEQKQNKVYSQLKSCSEISGSISEGQDINGALGPNSETENSIAAFHNSKVTLETDLAVKNIVLTRQNGKNAFELNSNFKNGDRFYNDEKVPPDLMNKDSFEYQNKKVAANHVNSKHGSSINSVVIVEKAETNAIVDNGFSGKSSSSVSDLTSEGAGQQGSLMSSTLSTTFTSTNAFNVIEILAQNKQQIDASLETRHTGDESSNQSSSEMKQDDHEVSTFSLAYSEAGATKDRLTFESIDSEYSEGGLMSPATYQLSPPESTGHPLDDTLPSRSASDDSARKRFDGNNHSIKTAKDVGLKSPSDHRSKDGGKSTAEWDPQKDGLQEMTLYAQGHSDTLLLLLVSRSVKCNKMYISSLWKSCLSHLAELDFQVNDAERHVKDDTENIGAQYQYIKYDSFTQNLKGSALLPITSLANEIVDSSIRMHDSFISMPDLQEITYRSHSACCYGNRSVNMETYFQLGLSRTAAGICPPNDKTFCLDQISAKNLAE